MSIVMYDVCDVAGGCGHCVFICGVLCPNEYFEKIPFLNSNYGFFSFFPMKPEIFNSSGLND